MCRSKCRLSSFFFFFSETWQRTTCRIHYARWLVFHASASYLLVTTLSRYHFPLKGSADILKEAVSKDWLELFDFGGNLPGWLNILWRKVKFASVDFPLPLAFHIPWRSQERFANKQLHHLTDRCTFLLTCWVSSLSWICLKTCLALPQESWQLLLQVLSGEMACGLGRDLGNTRTAKVSTTFCKNGGTFLQNAYAFIRDIHQNCTYVCCYEVFSEEIWHTWSASGLVTVATNVEWTNDSWLDFIMEDWFQCVPKSADWGRWLLKKLKTIPKMS